VDEKDNWAGALTLLDVVETFFDSRIDLLERQLRAHSRSLKAKATELIPKGLRTPRTEPHTPADELEYDETVRDRDGEIGISAKRYRREVEKEVEKIRLKLASKVTDLSSTWRSAQIVRTRDKVSFLFGVLSLAFTCLMIGLAPEWLPLAYSVQSMFYLPTRVWSYKRKAYHYFLFDLCYFVNVMDLVWLWCFPSNATFFITCYCLTMGPIASAIVTWRNSLVFHSLDKVTSIFIHMYPPLVLSMIMHFVPGRDERYPAIVKVSQFSWWQMILLSAVPYVVWQGLYWKFVIVARRSKIESGQRQTSFRYMLNDKRGPIGKMLQGVKPEYREASFMGGQLVYSIICMLPAACWLVHSPMGSVVFLVVIFSVSVWNGASYYVEVFGRKFERELEKLRKEMDAATASSSSQHSGNSLGGSPPATEDHPSPESGSSSNSDAKVDSPRTAPPKLANSPLVLEPAVVAEGQEGDVMGLNLDVDGIHPDETRKDR